LEKIGIGLGLSLVATAVNGLLALAMLQANKQLRSITLKADAHHLLTDVWTSVGVVLGLIFVPITQWLILDPIIAFIIAANIIWTGVRLLRETGLGLLDTEMPESERRAVVNILASYDSRDIQFQALRTRVAGTRRFVSLHVLVPGVSPVKVTIVLPLKVWQ
jgi:cation diffusion facilitator family transporter